MALIAVLEALDPPIQEGVTNTRRQLICVANTHIHANPELNDVKLWQVMPPYPPPPPSPGSPSTRGLGAMDLMDNSDLLTLSKRTRTVE